MKVFKTFRAFLRYFSVSQKIEYNLTKFNYSIIFDLVLMKSQSWEYEGEISESFCMNVRRKFINFILEMAQKWKIVKETPKELKKIMNEHATWSSLQKHTKEESQPDEDAISLFFLLVRKISQAPSLQFGKEAIEDILKANNHGLNPSGSLFLSTIIIRLTLQCHLCKNRTFKKQLLL